MGYYVSTIDNEFFLDKKHFDDVYKKMCELNDYDDLKRGGSYGSNEDVDPNERYPKNRWFSWMEYNYPETCKDMFEILTKLGFEWNIDNDGNMINLRYAYEKTGNEDYFLTCFAPFVKEGSYLEFEGEDFSHWKYVFHDGKMILQTGENLIVYSHSETYEFGEMSKVDKDMAIWRENFNKRMAEEQAAKALEK